MQNIIRKSSILGIAATALLIAANTADAVSIKGNNITLRMGSGHPPFITYVKEMSKYFGPNVVKRVAAETKYKLKFKEHYSGTVVNVFDTLEGVQDGRLDIVALTDAQVGSTNFSFFFGNGDGTFRPDIAPNDTGAIPTSIVSSSSIAHGNDVSQSR